MQKDFATNCNGFLSADGGVLLKDGCLKPSGGDDDPYWYFSGCGRVNIAGVFNNGVGENKNIPHRASVPNLTPFLLRMRSQT